MCYQEFIHYACGHDGFSNEEECALALDDPFWVSAACMNYHAEGKSSDFFCGTGTFYCGRLEADGPWLDTVHQVLGLRKTEFQQINAQMADIQEKAKQFAESANRHNIPQHVRAQHWAYTMLVHDNEQHRKRRVEVMQDGRKAVHILKYAYEYFKAKQRYFQQNGHVLNYPAFVLPADIEFPEGIERRVPFEPQPLEPINPLAPGLPRVPSYATMTEQAIGARQDQLTRQDNPLYSSEGENINVNHVNRCGGKAGPGRRAMQFHTPPMPMPLSTSLAGADSGVDEDATTIRITQPTAAGNSRRRKRDMPETITPAVPESSKNIRRSKRVPKKKIMYAESIGSDLSRETSPEKNRESPQKSISDWSEAPQTPEPPPRRVKKPQGKSQLGNNGMTRSNSDSLAAKIGDWKRRTGSPGKQTKGKSASHQDVNVAGGQAAGQRSKQQPTAKSLAMTASADSLITGTRGTSGFGEKAPSLPHAYNDKPGVLGRPFSDKTEAAALLGPNVLDPYNQSRASDFYLHLQPPHQNGK